MTIEEFLIRFFSSAPSLILKIFAILLLLLHVAFSIVLLRQAKLMVSVVEAKINSAIYLVSIIHLLFSIFVLFWAILFL